MMANFPTFWKAAFVTAVTISSVLSHEALLFSAPSNVQIISDTPVAKGGDLLSLFYAVLGLSSDASSWEGVRIKSPFGSADSLAVLTVHRSVHGSGIFHKSKHAHYRLPFKQDLDWNSVTTELDATLAAKFGEGALIKVQEQAGATAEEVSTIAVTSLNVSAPTDSYFLQELQGLQEIPTHLESLGKIYGEPQVLLLEITSLPLLESIYGKDSSALTEARSLLEDGILKLDQEMTKRNMALVTLSSSEKQLRTKRQAVPAQAAVDGDWPAVFNIMIWFVIAMALALLYVAVGIGSMDPGRDSIIYRMTSTRMKKDN